MAGLHQCVDDQARRPLDGDAHTRAEAGQAPHQLGQTLAVVSDLEALTHGASGVDDAHRVRLHGPVQAGEEFAAHRQTPGGCGMTAGVGRRGGKLINWRSSGSGVALHPVARRGLPAPRGLLVSWGPSTGKQRGQSPRGHGSRSIPSIVLLSRVKTAHCELSRAEHGLPTAAVGRFVASAARPPPWTTLHRAARVAVNSLEVAL